MELRDQTREAYAALKKERAAHDTNWTEAQTELEAVRHEANDLREQGQAERQRLKALHQRMKRRWHRHWAAERASMRRREADLAHQQEALEKDRHGLAQTRLAFNAEMEMGRRELKAGWDQLHREQYEEEEQQAQDRADLAEQEAALDDRDAALTEVERDLAAEQQHWHAARRKMEKEVEGLDNLRAQLPPQDR